MALAMSRWAVLLGSEFAADSVMLICLAVKTRTQRRDANAHVIKQHDDARRERQQPV